MKSLSIILPPRIASPISARPVPALPGVVCRPMPTASAPLGLAVLLLLATLALPGTAAAQATSQPATDTSNPSAATTSAATTTAATPSATPASAAQTRNDANHYEAPQDPAPLSQTEESAKFASQYKIHNEIEVGGHIAPVGGSGETYATFVNLHTGPRILSESTDMQVVPGAHPLLFDHLSSNSYGYGGDPYSATFLNFDKGRIYDFVGSFRRGRNYFDYDLLANPLAPATTGSVPYLTSPHLFNTVRKMTDALLTFGPLSNASLRIGFSQNNSEGPSLSTVHFGAEALLNQNWDIQTQNWTLGIDAKLPRHSSLSYDHIITLYRQFTSWNLAMLNAMLSNGTRVSGGVDFVPSWNVPCAAPFLPGGAYNPTCNGYTAYTRQAPTHLFTPTEQFRFHSAAIPRLDMNGRFVYSGSTATLDNFNETFAGNETRVKLLGSVETGAARIRRVNTSADYAVLWQVAHNLTLSNVVDYQYWRIPGTNSFTTLNYTGTSMLATPTPPTSTPAPVADYQWINQKWTSDTVLANWEAFSRGNFSLGYRYRTRTITDSLGDNIPIHEDWLLFGSVLQPISQLRINVNVDAMSADRAYTRISPRQSQHYVVRSTYKPEKWMTVTGTVNILESRDNVLYVHALQHNRNYSLGTVLTSGGNWSVDANYAYTSVYSTVTECYTVTPKPANPVAAQDPACIANGTPYQTNDYYNVPTQTGSIGLVFAPFTRIHSTLGYRATAVNGNAATINVRQVDGSLQSVYQTPYFTVAYDLQNNWQWKGSYDYYGYSEGSPIGPVGARQFHGNVYTLSVRYAF